MLTVCLEGSPVKGITKYGGGRSPTLPHREIAPDDRRSTTVSEMNCAYTVPQKVEKKILVRQHSPGRELERSKLCDTFPQRKTGMDVPSNKGIRIPEGKHRSIRKGMAANNTQDKLRGNVEVF